MINLKLAEYKEGKFEKFYNCGSDYDEFLFAGDSIAFLGDYSCQCCYDKFPDWVVNYSRDKKDPLKRFGGLFDGRTYGQGEFVLIQDDEDDIFKRIVFDGYEDFFEYSMTKKEDGEWQPSGNLHENPELYEKIKNI
jgi:hypothetical protein